MSKSGALELLLRRNASDDGPKHASELDPKDATYRNVVLGYVVLCSSRVDFVLLYRGLDLLHEATLGVFKEFEMAV